MSYAANTNYIQATIEIFGAIVSLVLSIMFSIMTGKEKKSEKNLLFLFYAVTSALFVDAAWYIVDGNEAGIAILLNRICNFLIFLCGPLELAFAGRYIFALLEEQGISTKTIYKRISHFLLTVVAIFPITNLFFKWIYSFDEYNVYYRLDGWYLYAALSAGVIFIYSLAMLIYRKAIPLSKQGTMFIFLFSPFIGIALQSANISISFIQIFTAISMLFVMGSYVADWIKNEKDKPGIVAEHKKFWLIEGVFAIMILCVSASIISCIVSLTMLSKRNSQQNSQAVAYMVSETIDGALSEPINVSRTMAQSDIIRKAVSMDNLEGSDVENDMVLYMNRIKEDYGYQMVFVAVDNTHAYYTYDGLSRYMDIDTDKKDAWYKEFRERNITYELNVDADKDNNMSLAVFVNMEIRNDENKVIGVCGVAMSMEALMDILGEYEQQYNVDVSLVDENGLIQVDSDRTLIENKIIDQSFIDNVNTDDFTYERSQYRAVLAKDMENLGWYLVIEDNKPDKLNVLQVIMPSMIIYIIGIILMITFIRLFGKHEKDKDAKILANKLLSETDKLTGLSNRYAFENCIDEIDAATMSKDLAVIMIDVNGLKTVNDTIGHAAGDEIIIGTADCIKEAFGQQGYTFRIGGDEFVVILNCSEADRNFCISRFEEITSNWKGKLVEKLSASLGVAEHSQYKDCNCKNLVEQADQLMYAKKSEYYEKKGIKRRTT